MQANIDRYLAKLDVADREEAEIREVTATELKQKIASMEAKMEQLKAHEAEVEAHPDHQVSLTDPDARSMMKAGGGSQVGYNVQTAVDSKHHLIVAHEVTNAPSDRSQLAAMAGQAREALTGEEQDKATPEGEAQEEELTVVADLGSYVGESFHQEVRRSHPVFDRAVGMFDDLLALPHRIRVLLKLSFRRFQYLFVLPTLDAAGIAGRAL